MPLGDRFAHHVVGDARTAVQHQRRVGRRMDLRQPFDVEPRSLLVEAVGRTDRHGQRIDAGRFDEPCGLFGRGEAFRPAPVPVWRRSPAPLRRSRRRGVPVRRSVGSSETFSSNGRSLASIITESNPHRDTARPVRPIRRGRGESTLRRRSRRSPLRPIPTACSSPHIVDRAARELQQHGSLHSLRSLHDGREGLEVIEIGRQHGRPVALAFFQQFFYVHYSRLLRSTRLNA